MCLKSGACGCAGSSAAELVIVIAGAAGVLAAAAALVMTAPAWALPGVVVAMTAAAAFPLRRVHAIHGPGRSRAPGQGVWSPRTRQAITGPPDVHWHGWQIDTPVRAVQAPPPPSGGMIKGR